MSDSAQDVVISVAGMHCDNCVRKVQAALEKTPGVRGVNVNLAAGAARVHVTADVSVPALLQAVRTTGFQATGFTRG